MGRSPSDANYFLIDLKILDGYHSFSTDEEVSDLKNRLLERFYFEERLDHRELKLQVDVLQFKKYRIHFYIRETYNGYIDWSENQFEDRLVGESI